MSTFITRFETESSRVKGVAFHASRPWFLASLHTGAIQLWDYRIGTLIDTFEEHTGPVRAVDFHLTQPLFVSGGDDFKVKVWNYKQRRCLFTLTDHLDYIRTVQFHHEYPWIVTASDDQTIRLFNWQSRQCVATLTGHNHYVMSARFHPREDLLVSASLDQTVRVWDLAPLRQQQTSAPARAPQEESAAAASLRLAQQELFGTSGAQLKYPPLEGHERGVNWAAFHPTLQLVVSAADDRTVKLWRMNDTRAWEVDTLRGHFNNVSCVLFHPRQDLIISDSEDKTIRVWDMAKRTCLHTFRREHDRFWILAAHPEQNVFAAGHDSGVIVFKLERERPAATVYRGKRQAVLFYLKDRHLRSYDFETARDVPVMSVRKPGMSWRPVSLSYSSAENCVIVNSRTEEGGSYELYRIPASAESEVEAQAKRGLGSDATFFARNKFVSLERGGQLVIRSAENEVVRRLQGPGNATALMPATVGRILCRTDEGAVLLDLGKGPQEDPVVGRAACANLKSAIWSGGSSKGGKEPTQAAAAGQQQNVALLGKNSVVLCTRDLQQLCVVHESVKVKSGAWDDTGNMFVYTTVNHIKYLLPNGDGGIIRTLDNTVYLMLVRGNKLFVLDRECKIRVIAVDITECYFKMALFQKSYDVVLRMVREANLIGNSMVGYLQRKGFPDIALHFVKDPLVRFNLAIECGLLDTALQACRVLEQKDCWERLAERALAVGDYATAELGLTRCGNTAGLLMLHVCSGNMQALAKLQQTALANGDVMTAFHASVYRGDMQHISQLLEKAGHLSLAFVSSATYGITQDAERLAETLQQKGVALPTRPVPPEYAVLPHPPVPLVSTSLGEWPRLQGRPQSVLDAALLSQQSNTAAAKLVAQDLAGQSGGSEDIGDWGGDDIVLPGAQQPTSASLDLGLDDTGAPAAAEEGGWGDLDLSDVLASGPAAGGAGAGGSGSGGGAAAGGGGAYFVVPAPGESRPRSWVRVSRLACDAACAGDWVSLKSLLLDQCGIVKLEPLKSICMALYRGCRLPVDVAPPSLLSGSFPLWSYVTRPDAQQSSKQAQVSLPTSSVALPHLIQLLQEAYANMNAGKFSTCKQQFQQILHSIPFLCVDTRDAEAEAKELLNICREYLTGIYIEQVRKEEKNGKRAAELAAYFSNCRLQAKHCLFVLRTAMKASLDIKNYLQAASFARRMLDLAPTGQFADQARQVVQFADKNPSDAIKLDYDERNPFTVCCSDLVPIYKGHDSVTCAFCKASYKPSHNGITCNICQVGSVGAKATGILISQFQRN